MHAFKILRAKVFINLDVFLRYGHVNQKPFMERQSAKISDKVGARYMRQQFCRPDFDAAFCAGGTLRARVSRRSLLRIIGAAELRGATMDYV